MRYINRIQRQAAHETPGVWLKSGKYIPKALLDSGPNYLERLELRQDDLNRLLLTIAHDKTIQTEPFGSMILDIDRISERPISTDPDAVAGTVTKLHEEIWKVFKETKSERLEQLLRGEPT